MDLKVNEDNLLIKLIKKIDNFKIDDNEPLSPPSEKSPVLNLTFDEIIIGMKTPDEIIQLHATQTCRELLSRQTDPPIDEMIAKGIVPLCIEFLKPQYSSKLQFEACWVLANITFGTSAHRHYVINQGVIPLLVELLKSPSVNVVENAVWVLGNIAGDGPGARDLVLQEKVLPLIIRLITPEISISFVRVIVWTLANLCISSNLAPPFKKFKDVLPLLNHLLDCNDSEVLGDTCRALSYLTDGPYEQIQTVVECGVVPKLIKLLTLQEIPVLFYALKTICSIVKGDRLLINMVIAHGGLPFFRDLLYHKFGCIVEVAARTIGNIMASDVEQIQQVLEANILNALVRILQEGDFKSQKEAALAIKNLTIKGAVIQIGLLIHEDILKPFCNLLMSKDWECVLIVLDGIDNIFNAAHKVYQVDQVVLIIEKIGGLEKLKELKKHDYIEIQLKATSMINLYFLKDKDNQNVLATNTENH